MVNKQEVERRFRSWFDTDNARFEVNDDGTISGEGWLETPAKFHKKKLPVRFKTWKGTVYLGYTNLHSLDGLPEVMDGDIRLRGNQLTDLKGAPKIVTGVFSIMQNPLVSLEGFPDSVGTVVLSDDPHLPMLRLLNAKVIKIHGARDAHNRVQEILQIYAGQGKRAMFDAQKDLEDAGFGGNARW